MSAKSKKGQSANKQEVNEISKEDGTEIEESGRSEDNLIYPREVNEQLLRRIQALTSDKEELNNQIHNKDECINKLHSEINSLKKNIKNIIAAGSPTTFTKSATVISSKITELCKRNRHLISELESFKTKCCILERKLLVSEDRPKVVEQATHQIEVTNDFNEVKDLKEKLARTSKNLNDARNKNMDLRNELLLANKCLQSEIGDSFVNVRKLANEHVGYKGRAEEIALLKCKLSDLEEKLLIRKNGVLTEKKLDQNLVFIKDMEARKRDHTQKMLMELQRLQQEHQDLRRKLDGANARIQILTCQGMTLRQKVQVLLGKSDNDDGLLAEQNNQLRQMEKKFCDQLQESNLTNEKYREQYNSALKDLDNEKLRVKAMHEQLIQKSDNIVKLKTQMNHVIDSSMEKICLTPLVAVNENELNTLTGVLVETKKRLRDQRRLYADLEKRYYNLKEIKLGLEKKYKHLYAENTGFKKTLIINRQFSSQKSLTSVSSTILATRVSIDSMSLENLSKEFNVECNASLKIDSLRNKLVVANEQIRSLESRMLVLEEERTSDFNCLEDMMSVSKKTFVDALKKLQTDI